MLQVLLSDPVVMGKVAAEVAKEAININTVVLAGFSLLGTLGTAYIGYLSMKIRVNTENAVTNTERAAVNTERAAANTKDTAVSVEKIHTAVNSEREAMMKKVEELHAKILQLTKEKEEQKQQQQQLPRRER